MNKEKFVLPPYEKSNDFIGKAFYRTGQHTFIYRAKGKKFLIDTYYGYIVTNPGLYYYTLAEFIEILDPKTKKKVLFDIDLYKEIFK